MNLFGTESKMDRTTKIILAFIAAGLWANAITPLIKPAQAQSSEVFSRIAMDTQTIAQSMKSLVEGGPVPCTNPKLC